ncbi:MAG: hypothetical protein HOO89_02375 [Ferruginibacter sp.]|nr:hypothetical protein [Ferruginibacter sp.]
MEKPLSAKGIEGIMSDGRIGFKEIIVSVFKRKFTSKLYHTLEVVSEFITNTIENITKESIKKTCGFEYIF